MIKYLQILKSAALFTGIEESELEPLLSCLGAKTAYFEKNQIIFMSGDQINSFGIVLSGQVQVYQEDYYGNRSIFANLGQGDLVGESFACSETKTLPVSASATTESALLFIDSRRLAAPCANACAFHSRLIRNLLNIIAMKNIALTQKIEFTSRRTTREKLLAYLSAEAQKAKSSSFSIPYNRQELADYLAVDRSAMSAELCRLRDSGVLNFRKNRFELL
jgi:CRP-like cAMP-binding protein